MPDQASSNVIFEKSDTAVRRCTSHHPAQCVVSRRLHLATAFGHGTAHRGKTACGSQRCSVGLGIEDALLNIAGFVVDSLADKLTLIDLAYLAPRTIVEVPGAKARATRTQLGQAGASAQGAIGHGRIADHLLQLPAGVVAVFPQIAFAIQLPGLAPVGVVERANHTLAGLLAYLLATPVVCIARHRASSIDAAGHTPALVVGETFLAVCRVGSR
ncbi:hypothetical protein D3C76_593210 [compost metagenome]